MRKKLFSLSTSTVIVTHSSGRFLWATAIDQQKLKCMVV